MANLNLSRRSFGLGLIAHGITACDKVENYAIPTKFAEKNVPIKGQVLDIAGFNLHGYIEGNGSQDIVFIHGALVNLRDWVFAARSLSKRDNRFIYIDRPGFGYSERDNSEWDAERQAEQARSYVKKFSAKNLILVGHSWGALVAMSWAAKYPEEVKGVISIAGLNMPFSGVSKIANDTGLFNLAYELYLTNVARKVDSGSIEKFAGRMFKPQNIPKAYLDYLGSDLSRRLSSIKANKNDLVVTSQALNKNFDFYNHMTMPIEIIHGEKDFLLPIKSQAVAFNEVIPNSRLHMLPAVGHMAHHFAFKEISDSISYIRNFS
ncbi:alpha/beta hydrolase [Paracoccaceae bacterium]|nr:alpha/beta hydrolase [Paracoccaceae bacterium]